jgi:hypothetical protein
MLDESVDAMTAGPWVGVRAVRWAGQSAALKAVLLAFQTAEWMAVHWVFCWGSLWALSLVVNWVEQLADHWAALWELGWVEKMACLSAA